MRVFFAVWPSPQTREQLAAVRDMLESPKARAVREEDLHLTLAFIGDVPNSRLPALQAAADAVERPTCELVLGDFQYFNSCIALGASRAPAELQAQRRHLLELAEPYALRSSAPRALQAFHPHVTLLRGVRKLPRLPTAPSIRFVASGFVLAQSDLAPSGARYRSICDYAPTGS